MDALFIILIILLGLFFINTFKSRLTEKDISTLKRLFFYHLIFSVYYCFFVQGDSVGYWRYPKVMEFDQVISFLSEAKGTYFLYSLNYFPSNLLGLSYFTGSMLYGLLGFIGLAYFYIIAIEFIPLNSKFRNYDLFPLVFYMPMLHFWSAGVGKDTLLFFCIGMFVYGTIKPLRRLPFMVFGLGFSYFLRPHVTLFLVMAFGLAYVSGSKISNFQRILFSVIMISIAVAILPTVMSFAKIEEASVGSFEEFAGNKASLLSRGTTGSRVDISSYPFPLKVFTFLFRPLFFDINGVPALVSSFENIILLILYFKVLRNNPIRTFNKAPFIVKGLVYFLIIGTLAFSQSLGNLGIMIRMRNMFLPGMLIFILWSFSFQKQCELEKQNQRI